MSEIATPVFLGGHRKSGTSMFLRLFDGHPQLLVYPQDINVLYAYFPVFVEGEYGVEERRKRLSRVIFEELVETLDRNDVTDRIDVAEFRDRFFAKLDDNRLDKMRHILDTLLEAFRETIRSPATGPAVIKETSIEIYGSELFTWYPNSKFTHLLRDPRDVYAALRAGTKGYYSQFGDNEKTLLSSFLHRGLLGMKLAALNRERFGPERYAICRFEDVVSDPEQELTRICTFIGVDFDERLLVPTVLGAPTRGNSHDKIDLYEISNRNVGRWRERITPEEAMVIEFHFGDLMESFGYKREFATHDTMDAAANFYKFSNYKYFFFDRFAE
ncbi:MAG: sulfotransferase [Alphaproteobacteria bacterium]